MIIFKVNLEKPQKKVIQKATQVILAGGSVVIPTDTAYGLAVNALDEKAVKRLIRLKKRLGNKPLPLGVANLAQAKRLAYFSKRALEIAKKFWPGALTIVLRAKKLVPRILTSGTQKIGLRIPASKVCTLLAQNLRFPYTITSANLSGGKTPYSGQEVVRQFFNQKLKPDLILDGGQLPLNPPSTVVLVSGNKFKILRQGVIDINVKFKYQKSK